MRLFRRRYDPWPDLLTRSASLRSELSEKGKADERRQALTGEGLACSLNRFADDLERAGAEVESVVDSTYEPTLRRAASLLASYERVLRLIAAGDPQRGYEWCRAVACEVLR